MRRKVIKQGNNTLTVTLPRSWTKQYNVEAGSEIEVIEQGNILQIMTDDENKVKTVRINAKGLTPIVLRWILSAAHKTGFDEMEVLHENPQQLHFIHQVVRDTFIGFSVMKQTNKSCVIKSISKEIKSEFDRIYRKSFLVVLSMSESVYDMLKAGDYEHLPALITLEDANNQFTNFCKRIINKKGTTHLGRDIFYCVIGCHIEKICDEYRHICRSLSKPFIIHPQALEALKEANNYFRRYYELFYAFNLQKLCVLADEAVDFRDKADKLHAAMTSYEDSIVISAARGVVMKCTYCSQSMIAINEFKGE